MILSHACEYGVQALVHLNAYPPGTYVPVRSIALAQRISPTFLSKVVRQLVTSRLLCSMKGPGGGVCLSRPADRILLIDIVRAIDGLDCFERCVLGKPHFCDKRTCPVYSFWTPIRHSMHRVLADYSLSDLSPTCISKRGKAEASRRGVCAGSKRNKGA